MSAAWSCGARWATGAMWPSSCTTWDTWPSRGAICVRAGGLFAEALGLHAETRRSAASHPARGVAECLAGLAAVAARAGQATPAARLFGAATALGLHLESQWDDADRRERDRYAAVARDALGLPAFSAARAQGEGLTLEEAIAEAQAVAAFPDLDPPPPQAPAAAPTPASAPPSRRQVDGLTPREREVAALVAEGLTNRQVATRLVISESTAAQRRRPHLEQARLPQPGPDCRLGRRPRPTTALARVT